jgi:hypothetical protein
MKVTVDRSNELYAAGHIYVANGNGVMQEFVFVPALQGKLLVTVEEVSFRAEKLAELSTSAEKLVDKLVEIQWYANSFGLTALAESVRDGIDELRDRVN